MVPHVARKKRASAGKRPGEENVVGVSRQREHVWQRTGREGTGHRRIESGRGLSLAKERAVARDDLQVEGKLGEHLGERPRGGDDPQIEAELERDDDEYSVDERKIKRPCPLKPEDIGRAEEEASDGHRGGGHQKAPEYACARAPQHREEADEAHGRVDQEGPVRRAVKILANGTGVRGVEGKEELVEVVCEREDNEERRDRRYGRAVPFALLAETEPRRAERAGQAQRRHGGHGDVVAVPQVAGQLIVGRLPLDYDHQKPEGEDHGDRRDAPPGPRVEAAQVGNAAPERERDGREADPDGAVDGLVGGPNQGRGGLVSHGSSEAGETHRKKKEGPGRRARRPRSRGTCSCA